MSPERRRQSIPRLVLVPALVTLALTQLRLTGDLLGWSEMGLPFEIAWLVPLFGAYFALHLRRVDDATPSAARVLRGTLLPLALFIAGLILLRPTSGGMGLLSLIAIVLVQRNWPRLGNALLTYAFAARLPVIVTMLAATLGRWDTVFDVSPYNALAGTLPQLTVWLAFTVVAGSVAASVALAVRERYRADQTKPFPGSTAPG
ncbi:MAG: hypothetical protein E2P02_09240 [Acidobacteria bacterium]|nr:MAG: hypothetical protein E2P02_09240 [Acidobacteriota bacterium]